MYRFAIEHLKQWKSSTNRKPLILEGAKQVGKTWLMQEFARTEYGTMVYLNFETDKNLCDLFSNDLDRNGLVLRIELYVGKKINPQHTLLIFDEIQECPQALSALQYFYETASEYHVICGASFLENTFHQNSVQNGIILPIGKVEFLKLYPLSFEEFLIATDFEHLAELLQKGDDKSMEIFHAQFIEALKYYCYVGGMPEVVLRFAKNKDFSEARELQKRILNTYEQDFLKYAPNDILPKIRMIWNAIPSQLAKDNKKFIYKLLKFGGRTKEFETAIMWLTDCGFIYKVNRITSGMLPTQEYEDLKAFKLFLLDVGLLSCMLDLNQQTLIKGNEIFSIFEEAITEQYVLQQLKTLPKTRIYYYTNDRNAGEIDFIVDNGTQIIPLEVKAQVNLKSKSLKFYQEKYNIPFAMQTAIVQYRQMEKMVNIPLYAIEELKNIVVKKNKIC